MGDISFEFFQFFIRLIFLFITGAITIACVYYLILTILFVSWSMEAVALILLFVLSLLALVGVLIIWLGHLRKISRNRKSKRPNKKT